MHISAEPAADTDDSAALFVATFPASVGAAEGDLIGGLVRRPVTDTPAANLRVFTARDAAGLAGAILCTRLGFERDARTVFLLAPVAVAPERQGQGIGQRLIGAGLDALRAEGVDIVATYGDPAFYGRVGFAPVTVADLPAPLPLSQPEGWLAQSLTAAPPTPVAGPARCVPAFDDPAFW